MTDNRIVCSGDTLKCSAGTITSTFSATRNVCIQGKAIGLVTDNVHGVNITSFGMCVLQQNKVCIPMLIHLWSTHPQHLKICGQLPITKSSTIMCQMGGCILVDTVSQDSVRT